MAPLIQTDIFEQQFMLFPIIAGEAKSSHDFMLGSDQFYPEQICKRHGSVQRRTFRRCRRTEFWLLPATCHASASSSSSLTPSSVHSEPVSCPTEAPPSSGCCGCCCPPCCREASEQLVSPTAVKVAAFAACSPSRALPAPLPRSKACTPAAMRLTSAPPPSSGSAAPGKGTSRHWPVGPSPSASRLSSRTCSHAHQHDMPTHPPSLWLRPISDHGVDGIPAYTAVLPA